MRYSLPLNSFSRWSFLVLLLLVQPWGLAFAQQAAGKVEHVQGLVSAQQADGVARLLEKNDPLHEGDTLTTTERSYAVIALSDGSRMTLRPATTFTIEHFSLAAGSEAAAFRLLKGGLRTLTGLIAKRNPDAVRFQTPTATIGIRGTSFDARICGEDCRREERQAQLNASQQSQADTPAPDTPIARIARISGEVGIQGNSREARKPREGAPVYAGDEIRTGKDAIVVIAFKDRTSVSVEPSTRFRVEEFSYQRKEQPDSISLRLLRGGLRTLTGLIGKSRPEAVKVHTLVATIGIRGTGMDIRCEGPCAEGPANAPVKTNMASKTPASRTPALAAHSGLFATVWEGRIFIGMQGAETDVDVGSTGFAGASGPVRLLSVTPAWMMNFVSPRPDQIVIDWDNLFGNTVRPGGDGLYMYVRDGHVYLQGTGGLLDYGVGEAGYVGADGTPRRLEPVPRFLRDDPFPLPEMATSELGQILQVFGVTLGEPRQEICEIY